MIKGYSYDERMTLTRHNYLIDAGDRQALKAWALAAGIDLLEDDDVVVKDGFVVPKEIVPGTAYVASEMLRELSTLHTSSATWDSLHWLDTSGPGQEANKVAAYIGDLPLRVIGVFADDNGHVAFCASRNSPQAVVSRVFPNPRFESVVVIRAKYKQVRWGDVPKSERSQLLHGVLRSRPYDSRFAAVMRNLEFSVLSPMNQGLVARHKGTTLTGGEYVATRQLCIRFAGMVREAVDGYGDVVAAIELIDSCRQSLGDRLIEAWNTATGDTIVRGVCGHVFPENEGNDTANGLVCDSCFEEDYRHCVDTDDYRYLEDCYFHDDDECYRTYPPRDDDDDDDDDDDEDSDRNGLLCSWGASCSHLAHDKSFTPSSTGDFTMGIELEVQATDNRSDSLRDCNDHFNRDVSYAMFKRDGSLSDSYGFEIVTAARRLNDHLIKFKEWEPEDLESWDAGCCGMHVHIDSRAFTPLSLGKFLMFYNQTNNHDFIRDIAGRHPDTDYGAKDYARKIGAERTVNPIKVKRAGDNNSRYNMVNVTNLTDYEQDRLGVNVTRDSKGRYSTVEVRIFRGTLRKARLLAQIEFAHASVIFCRSASWQELDGDAFKFWLSKTSGYPNLRKWFGVFPSRNKQLVTAANEEDSTVEI
ncbi:MAG TPA: amidoligase family protein [Thiobacillus sp.]|nr:amidoligase family protein [Thiobacillus sp.]